MSILLQSLFCLSIAHANTPDETDPTEFVTPETEPQPLTLLYTGNQKGVSSERYPFPSISQIQKSEATGELQSHSFQPRLVPELEGWLVESTELGLIDLLDHLKSEELTCQAPVSITAIENPVEILFIKASQQSKISDLLAQTDSQSVAYSELSCLTSDKKTILLRKQGTHEKTPSFQKSIPELRRAYSAQLDFGKGPETILSVGKPAQEFSRSHQLTKDLLANSHTLYVDAGNFVDGASSIVPLGTSLHRPMAYQALADLNPAALGFGLNELIAGPDHFVSEIQGHSLPYIASNWKTEQSEYSFPDHLTIEFTQGKNTGTIAFLSLLDPQIHRHVPSLEGKGIEITDPVEAAQNIVDRLTSSQTPPDVIVVLTTAGADVKEDLRIKLKGAQLLIGDTTMATLRIKARRTDFLPIQSQSKAAPLTLPMDGLAEAQLIFENGHLQTVINRPMRLNSDRPPALSIREQITQSRLEHYDADSHHLIQTAGSGSRASLSQAEWSQMVCEALRRHTGADTVLLRELPQITQLPGPLRQKDIADALAVMDIVEQHRIVGSKFGRFLDQSTGLTPIACGALPGAAYPKAKGRSIDPDQMYVVVTTDLTRMANTLEQTLSTHTKDYPFDPPAGQALRTDQDRPLSLREAVIEELTAIESAQGLDRVYPYLTTESPAEKTPLWLLRSRGVSLRSESFQGMEDETFAAVPETLATSPTSSTLGYVADLALEYSDAKLMSDLRYQSTFTELTADEIESEIEDDWKLSTSVTRPSWGFSTGGMFWMPYSELLYDSEYTPIEDENGIPSPFKQSDLSVRSGLSTLPWKCIRNIRIAALANRDIAQLDEKPTEYAALAQLEARWFFSGGFLWSATGEYLWYGETPDDDPSDLRVRASGMSRLSYPFSRMGSVSVYGESLLIKGRVPETSDWGLAYTMGVSLDVMGAITLNRF